MTGKELLLFSIILSILIVTDLCMFIWLHIFICIDIDIKATDRYLIIEISSEKIILLLSVWNYF